MNRLVIEGCFGLYTFAPSEQVTVELLNDLMVEARSAEVLNVDLLVEMHRANTERELLTDNLFAYAGSQQRNDTENHQMVTYCIFRRGVRNTGISLSPNTTLPVTPLEASACDLMKQRMGEPLSESRLAYLQSLGKQEPAPEVESPIFTKLRDEILILEARQKFDSAEMLP